jgi:hypothetical protein
MEWGWAIRLSGISKLRSKLWQHFKTILQTGGRKFLGALNLPNIIAPQQACNSEVEALVGKDIFRMRIKMYFRIITNSQELLCVRDRNLQVLWTTLKQILGLNGIHLCLSQLVV